MRDSEGVFIFAFLLAVVVTIWAAVASPKNCHKKCGITEYRLVEDSCYCKINNEWKIQLD